MADTIDFEVRGLLQAEKKVAQIIRDLHGEATLKTMRDATLIVTGAAKKNAPVDTGRLRASITPSVTMEGNNIIGVVGSNVTYAPYQELGFASHFVPVQYIGTWARRHGFGEVGLIVSGKAKRFLQRAFEENRERIVRVLENGIHKIVEKK